VIIKNENIKHARFVGRENPASALYIHAISNAMKLAPCWEGIFNTKKGIRRQRKDMSV
jgi:hypothetical protein